MKIANSRLAKVSGPVLLLAACLALSSCIIVDPHHHHRRYDRPMEGSAPYSQGVRP
jgi:hypothetical protein